MTTPTDLVADELDPLLKRLRQHGDLLVARVADWTDPGRVPKSDERGGGLGDASPEEKAVDRREARQAGKYQAEVDVLLERLLRDASRLNRIAGIVMPRPPRRIEGKDMLAAQVAAAGLCVSCFRFDMTNKDRERDDHGQGDFYDKERCRRCAGFKRDHGIDPPLMLLEAWHARGKSWTTAMVAEALAAAGVSKGKASQALATVGS